MTTEITLNTSQGVSVFNSMDAFQQAQRMVVPLSQSTMVPDAYKNNIPNCMVAMEMSHRTGRSVLEIMQNMQPVKGNIGWKSEYIIMRINMSGLYQKNLRFVFSEDRTACYAIATTKDGEEMRGTTVSVAMAKAEGWYERNGSKWKTMPEQVLMYRAATFFSRVHCPEVLAGVQTADEIIDIGYIETPQSNSIAKFNEAVSGSAADPAETTAFEEVSEDHAAAAESEVVSETVETENDGFSSETPAPDVVKLEEDNDF